MEKIRIGISACLLGEAVRFDGGHKLDRFLRDTLGKYMDYVTVCPEAECGLGVPREPMHLEGDPGSPRLVTIRTRRDLTDRMKDWAGKKLKELEEEELCGFIFKSGSPSSGMERVNVYDGNNVPRKVGAGIFASAFMQHFPLPPVEDEGRLHDPTLRENFIERIFVLKRWRDMVAEGMKMKHLFDFHSRHKLLIMAHSPRHATQMGSLLAKGKDLTPDRLGNEYAALLMEALRLKATLKKNTNVLQHLMGYFKRNISADEKQELLEIIQRYHQGLIPLIVPVTLIQHYVRRYDQPYLKDQVYLAPHPMELQLRNHV